MVLSLAMLRKAPKVVPACGTRAGQLVVPSATSADRSGDNSKHAAEGARWRVAADPVWHRLESERGATSAGQDA